MKAEYPDIDAPPTPRRQPGGLAAIIALPLAIASFLVTSSARAAGFADAYQIETITMPDGVDPQIGGLDILPDGRVVCAFHRGEVFFYDPSLKKWTRFASGLHEPLGVLAVSGSEILVMQRPELTRLRDTDGDGIADRYETAWDGFGMTGNYHEFAYGPVRDSKGDLFVALNLASSGASVHREVRGDWKDIGLPFEDFFNDWKKNSTRAGRMFSRVPWRGWVLKLDHSTFAPTPWSCGFRSPDGLGFDAQGRLLVTDNQGDWVGTSALFATQAGAFHGHPASLVWRDGWTRDPMTVPVDELQKLRTAPAVLFPHGLMANSPTQPVCDSTGGKFGPFAGQILVGEMNTPRIMRVMLDDTGGALQGACIPFCDGSGLHAGNHRLAFAPDGSLWVGQIHLAWAGGEGLQRISWRGLVPLEVLRVSPRPGGFLFTFTKPLAESLPPVDQWKIRHYSYAYYPAYGSPQIDGTPVEVKSTVLQNHGRDLWIEVGNIAAGGVVYEFNLPPLTAQDGSALINRLVCYTVNRAP